MDVNLAGPVKSSFGSIIFGPLILEAMFLGLILSTVAIRLSRVKNCQP
jgi:hypothetical protein